MRYSRPMGHLGHLSSHELLNAYKENELWRDGTDDKEFIIELFRRLLVRSECAFIQHYQKKIAG
jgi:hypothetical protein